MRTEYLNRPPGDGLSASRFFFAPGDAVRQWILPLPEPGEVFFIRVVSSASLS